MMQSAKHRTRHDLPTSLDHARERRIAIERLVRPRSVVVVDVLAKGSKEMTSPERDDLVRALT